MKDKPILTQTTISRISQMAAFIADFFVLLPIRIVILLVAQFISKDLQFTLGDSITEKFESWDKISLRDKEHITYLLNQPYLRIIILALLLCVIVGFLYRTFMLASSWRATVGQRFAGLQLVSFRGNKIRFADIMFRVIVVYMGWLWPILFAPAWLYKKSFGILALVLTSIWGDMSFIFGKRISMADLATGTIISNGVSQAKFTPFYDE